MTGFGLNALLHPTAFMQRFRKILAKKHYRPEIDALWRDSKVKSDEPYSLVLPEQLVSMLKARTDFRRHVIREVIGRLTVMLDLWVSEPVKVGRYNSLFPEDLSYEVLVSEVSNAGNMSRMHAEFFLRELSNLIHQELKDADRVAIHYVVFVPLGFYTSGFMGRFFSPHGKMIERFFPNIQQQLETLQDQ